MALTSPGTQLALVDAGNGRVTIQWAHGNPVFDDSQDETVLSLLVESPGWFGDRAKKRRSLLPSVKTRDSSTPSKIEQYARDTLQPAIDDGRLRSVTPTATALPSGYQLTVQYVTGDGKTGAVTVPLTV